MDELARVLGRAPRRRRGKRRLSHSSRSRCRPNCHPTPNRSTPSSRSNPSPPSRGGRKIRSTSCRNRFQGRSRGHPSRSPNRRSRESLRPRKRPPHRTLVRSTPSRSSPNRCWSSTRSSPTRCSSSTRRSPTRCSSSTRRSRTRSRSSRTRSQAAPRLRSPAASRPGRSRSPPRSAASYARRGRHDAVPRAAHRASQTRSRRRAGTVAPAVNYVKTSPKRPEAGARRPARRAGVTGDARRRSRH